MLFCDYVTLRLWYLFVWVMLVEEGWARRAFFVWKCDWLQGTVLSVLNGAFDCGVVFFGELLW